jgi:DNA-binding CsgD family transcriptional regulator
MTVETSIEAGHGWAALPEPVRLAAHARCTAKQLQALKLAAAGYGSRRAGRILGISPDAYRARLNGGMNKIRDELGVVQE